MINNKQTIIKSFEIKNGNGYSIHVFRDGSIMLPSHQIDYKTAVGSIDAIQKAIEFVRDSGVKQKIQI